MHNILLTILVLWLPYGALADDYGSKGWVALFDGTSLTGWTPKIRGYKAGEDPLETFHVEDGLLRVSYQNYDRFRGRFGHLFFEQAFDHYRLSVEYRFQGEQLAGGPGWARRNSGVMLHAQAPTSLAIDQDFPDAIEAQFLGGLDNGKARPTANVCSPGTEVTLSGQIKHARSHCNYSTSPTLDGDQWVRAEFLVRGSDLFVHYVNGEEVLRFGDTMLSHDSGAGLELSSGHIALQSESHPIDFRRIAIKIIPAETPLPR